MNKGMSEGTCILRHSEQVREQGWLRVPTSLTSLNSC